MQTLLNIYKKKSKNTLTVTSQLPSLCQLSDATALFTERKKSIHVLLLQEEVGGSGECPARRATHCNTVQSPNREWQTSSIYGDKTAGTTWNLCLYDLIKTFERLGIHFKQGERATLECRKMHAADGRIRRKKRDPGVICVKEIQKNIYSEMYEAEFIKKKNTLKGRLHCQAVSVSVHLMSLVCNRDACKIQKNKAIS